MIVRVSAAAAAWLGVTMLLPAAGEAQPERPVPFRGWDEGSFHVAGTCGDGGVLFEATTYGRASHVGAFRMEASECDVPSPSGYSVTDGQFTIYAANGDTLTATYQGSGTGTGDSFSYTIVEEFTGGTGRFEGASGSAAANGSGTVDPSGDGTVRETFEGELVLGH